MTTTTFAAIDTNTEVPTSTDGVPSTEIPTSTDRVPGAEAPQPTAPTEFITPEPGQAAAPAQNPASTRGFAITSFVLGIASVVAGWTFIAPIIGFVFGLLALRRGTTERALALWGVWINGVILALAALGVLFAAALVGAGFLTLPLILA